ncbi:MAG: universal stress protein [Thermoleophilaceae bacterium]
MAASDGLLGEHAQPLDLGVTVVRETGDPADVLVRVARERAAAAIFTGLRGRNAVSSALFGSVSAGVLEGCGPPGRVGSGERARCVGPPALMWARAVFR